MKYWNSMSDLQNYMYIGPNKTIRTSHIRIFKYKVRIEKLVKYLSLITLEV